MAMAPPTWQPNIVHCHRSDLSLISNISSKTHDIEAVKLKWKIA